MLIPDLAMKRGIGRWQTRRIQNGMDESEVGKKKKRCNLCGADGHTYKKCPQLSVPTAAAEAGPSGNPTDGSAPPTRIRAHLVVHVISCNVFVCTKLSILCIYYVQMSCLISWQCVFLSNLVVTNVTFNVICYVVFYLTFYLYFVHCILCGIVS